MIRQCHKQRQFVRRIEQALGVSMGTVSCKIVDRDGMTRAMQGAGWSHNDAAGVVGFQVKEKVYVLDSAPWTVLHELIHRAGVNSDRLSRYVAEGLTEAIARELKQSEDEHRPTYPQESRWVQETLLPGLGMTAVQLGRVIANSSDPPRDLARLMVRARPGASESQLKISLAPQKSGRPDFNMTVTRVQSYPSTTDSERAGWVLLLASLVLLAPGVTRRLRQQ